ncbi:MAG: hypothetical protein WBD67_01320 [Terracidiphilus sp.]
MRTALIALSFFLSLAAAPGQQEKKSVLLPESEVKSLAPHFQRTFLLRIQGAWQPSEAQMQRLKAGLSQVSSLRSVNSPPNVKIANPEKYFRQYLAVVRAGKKLIYVNAFCSAEDLPYWHSHLVTVMDGGDCFWQAWYDPITEKFFDLSINGRG